MSSSASSTATSTFTQDVQNVVRKFKADLRGFAESTAGMTRDHADDISYDVETLCLGGYLKEVQVVLFSGQQKQRATTYLINSQNERRVTDRPGAAIWPKVYNPHLTVILLYTPAYHALTEQQRQQVAATLKCSWSPSSVSTDHRDLRASGERGYNSNAFGFERKDYT